MTNEIIKKKVKEIDNVLTDIDDVNDMKEVLKKIINLYHVYIDI